MLINVYLYIDRDDYLFLHVYWTVVTDVVIKQEPLTLPEHLVPPIGISLNSDGILMILYLSLSTLTLNNEVVLYLKKTQV